MRWRMSRRSGFNDSFNVHVDDLEAGNSNGSGIGAFASNRSDLDRWYFRALSNDSLVVTGAGRVTRTSSFSSEGEHENASVWSSRHFRSNRTFLAMTSSGVNFDDEDTHDEERPSAGDKATSSVHTSATISEGKVNIESSRARCSTT